MPREKKKNVGTMLMKAASVGAVAWAYSNFLEGAISKMLPDTYKSYFPVTSAYEAFITAFSATLSYDLVVNLLVKPIAPQLAEVLPATD